MFKVLRTHPFAKLPTRAHPGDAGYDLCSVQEVVIPPRSKGMVDTGLIVEIPQDCYARVAPRSGLAAKYGIDVLAGVVDSGYRANIKVILLNNGDTDFIVQPGDRIAQVIFERIYTPILQEVDVLEDTARGTSGFGSTGN